MIPKRTVERLVEFAATLTQPEPKRKHRLVLGAALAAPALPLLHGSAKLAQAAWGPKIGKVIGKIAPETGKRIASSAGRMEAYIEGANIASNRGLGGKVAGAILQNPKSKAAKLLVPGKQARSHYSAFRASPREALDATFGETLHAIQKKKNIPAKMKASLLDKHMQEAGAALDHFDDLTANKGYNTMEALKHVTRDPRHAAVLRRGLPKIEYAPQYAGIAAGAAAVPLAVGGAVAATKKRDRR